MKKTILLAIISLVVGFTFAQCKKKEVPAAPAVPTVKELTGTPAQNMVTVMEMGVNALKNNPDAAAAASALKKIMADYNIAGLRAAAKAAKDAGQGATEAEKNRFQALQDEYKALAVKVGAANPGAFNDAHAEWSKAWGIN